MDRVKGLLAVSLCAFLVSCGQSPAARCEAAAAALQELQLAQAAENGPVAIQALEKFIAEAEQICSPEFEAARLKLPLVEQAKVKQQADAVKLFVLSFGSSNFHAGNAELDARAKALAMRVAAELGIKSDR
jgi:hypothetical protein